MNEIVPMIAVLFVFITPGCISSMGQIQDSDDIDFVLDLKPNISTTTNNYYINSTWINGSGYLYPNSSYSDNVQINGWLNVSLWFKAWSDSVIEATLNITNNLNVGGNTSITQNINIGGDSSVTGDASIGGDTGITGNLTVNESIKDSNSSGYIKWENGIFTIHLE